MPTTRSGSINHLLAAVPERGSKRNNKESNARSHIEVVDLEDPQTHQASSSKKHLHRSKRTSKLSGKPSGSSEEDDRIQQTETVLSSKLRNRCVHPNRLQKSSLMQDQYQQKPTKRPFNYYFVSKEASGRYRQFENRGFIDMMLLPAEDPAVKDAKEIIETAGLIHTVTNLNRYVPQLVMEFYANVPELEMIDGNYVVYVRGQNIVFCSKLINDLFEIGNTSNCSDPLVEPVIGLDEHVQFATNGVVKQWKDMQRSYLSQTMKVLLDICSANWLPWQESSSIAQLRLRMVNWVATKIPFDYGVMVHNQIIAAACTPDDIRFRLPFPNVIYVIIKSQHTNCDHGDSRWSFFPPLVPSCSIQARDQYASSVDKESNHLNISSTSTLNDYQLPISPSARTQQQHQKLFQHLEELNQHLTHMLECNLRGEYGTTTNQDQAK